MLIGKTIKQLRKIRRITQMELAEAVGISNVALSNIEKDISKPSDKNLKLILEVLKVPETHFYLMSLDGDDLPANEKYIYKFFRENVLELLNEKLKKDE